MGVWGGANRATHVTGRSVHYSTRDTSEAMTPYHGDDALRRDDAAFVVSPK
jgi:hypothetical protein